jgi:(p)ppGpp synthase/HD superfamily hydrolase
MNNTPNISNPYAVLFYFLLFRKCPERAFLQLPVVAHSAAVRKAYALAKVFHDGQLRKSGEAYFTHPLATAWFLISAGVRDEAVLCAALLHDTLEDCRHLVTAPILTREYGVSPETVTMVTTLTQQKHIEEALYWKRISRHPGAVAVRLADRLHNMLTLEGVFPAEKQLAKIQETKNRVFPLANSRSLQGSEFFQPSKTLCQTLALVCDALSHTTVASLLTKQAG